MRALTILSCLFWMLMSIPANAAPSAGEVIFVKGNVTARDSQDKVRTLTKGATVNAGDTVVTGTDALVQLRFIDNAMLSLRENTEYRIDAYRYDDKNVSEPSSIATLIKGGFRSITGFITKRRPESFQVKTASAIIGVRGTAFSVYYSQSQGLAVGVTQGTVFLQNNTGVLDLGPSSTYQYAQVVNMNTVMIGSNRAPPVLINIMSDGMTSIQSTTGNTSTLGSTSSPSSAGGSTFLPPPTLDPKFNLQPVVQPSASSSGGPLP